MNLSRGRKLRKRHCTYLKGDTAVTSESGSKRKCSWDTTPLVVLIVTTGKPICSTHVFMIFSTVSGS